MSDLTVNGTSSWIAGTPDTRTILSDGPTGDVGVAAQVNGLSQFALDVQTVLGAATTLKGSATDLASRLGVLLATNGALQSGIAFPVSPPPVAGQLFFRTDSNIIYVYDANTGQWIFGFVNALYALLDGTANFTGSLTIKAASPGLRLIGQEANALDWSIKESGGTVHLYQNTGTEAVPVLTEDNFFVPTGGCIEYDGTSAPPGWLFADGSAVSRTTYARLFAVVGTAFGAGDGSTTFNVRDKRGRVSIGIDAATGRITSASFNGANAAVLGGVGGFETHTLNLSQIPVHAHQEKVGGVLAETFSGGGTIVTAITGTGAAGRSSTGPENTASVGGGASHSNTPPWLACNFIVKT